MRVAHLVSHPIQYFAPLYREIAAREGIELTVFFYSDLTSGEFLDPEFGRVIAWDTPLIEGYDHEFLPSARGKAIAGRARLRPNLDVVRALRREDFDVAWIHGYSHPNVWLAYARSMAGGPPLLIRDEPTLLEERAAWRRALKYPALRALFSRSFGLYIGKQNRRYLEHYGLPAERMFPAPYCVDNDFFQRHARQLAGRRAELRRELGVTDDAPVLLYAAKFIERKQPLEVLRAFAEARRASPAWLLMVGDGALLPDARALVERERIPNVLFPGFLNQSEILSAYASADMLVLFSREERWGLVVNEAMNFSLPVVVSDRVGSKDDLVEEGANGHVVPVDDTSALAQALSRAVADPSRLADMGRRSLEIVDRHGIQACADGIVGACRAVAGGR